MSGLPEAVGTCIFAVANVDFGSFDFDGVRSVTVHHLGLGYLELYPSFHQL